MTPPPVLDTHVWIWWMLGDPGLSRTERDASTRYLRMQGR